MRPNLKRFVAALVGAATLLTPVSAFAGDYCSTYAQVESKASGGQFVGGLLMYETMGTVTRHGDDVTVTTTTSSTAELGIPGSSAGNTVTISTTVNTPGTIVVTQEPIGYYQMNDGSVYQIRCLTGNAEKVS